MDTKGKAVDSVIQYQLHKQSRGDSSNTSIKVVTVTMVEREATQEDVDNYMLCYDILGNDIIDIEVGKRYRIFEISANYNEISNYDIVIIKDYGNFVSSGYSLVEDFYNLFQPNGNETIKQSYYSVNINANLRQYIYELNV